jgi:2-polyprenyl-3-methyl-5-hydroxy-6-metoxy-1,4-benzoquinol methylase
VTHKEAQVTIGSDLSKEVQAIWDQNATFWDGRMGEGNSFQRILVGPAVDRLLQIQPGEEVLDIACGNGVASRRLAQAGGRVVAFDFSPQFIELARGRDAGSANPVEYHVIDATDEAQMLALGEGRFDAALSNMAIMDMTTIEPLMSAVSKLLKPGGRFVFSLMHPCFNGSGMKLCVEEDDAGGEIRTVHSVKVSKYGGGNAEKGLGMIGQPAPQYYFHRTLTELFTTCFRAGFVLEGIEEPTFAEEADTNRPLSWVNFRDIPPAMVVRMRQVK